MALSVMARRRWLGALALGAAALMLVLGGTVLKDRLSSGVFLGYWFVCFIFTGAAVLLAFLDLKAAERRIREEQRELLEDTLQEIERGAKGGRGGRGSGRRR